QAQLIRAILQGFAQRGAAIPSEIRAWASRSAVSALKSHKAAHLLAGVEIAGLTGQPEFADRVAEIAMNRKRSEELRTAAITAIAASRPGVVAGCLADAGESLDLREKADEALGTVNSNDARAGLVAALPTAPNQIASPIAFDLGGTKL